MNIVIQCSASKHGQFFNTKDSRKVYFVADPKLAPKDDGYVYAHPDDVAEDGLTWRETLVRYNMAPGNSMGLARAFELYGHAVYRRLVEKFGVENVFILSAGWGLIRAGFLTAYYDITFISTVKQKGEPYKFRRAKSTWNDLRQLTESDVPVVFFGGKDYLPLFCALTQSHRGKRFVFYNSDVVPATPGCLPLRYQTTTRTNWHYECANAFLHGRIDLSHL